MPIQSLGIFESVFDWVYDKIIDPIVSWLGDILESMFSWILDEIIVPFIKPVFNLIWNILVVNIRDLFYTPFYLFYTKFLYLLDQLQGGFDILIGLKDITYTDDNGIQQSTTLLNYMIYNDTIRNVLISITFIALALSIIFAIYSVIRSTLDFDFEGRRPVSKVMKATLKTMISFLIVPLIVWFGLNLSSILLKQTSTAIMGGEDASIGRWILAISCMKAVGPYTIEEMMDGIEKTTPIYNDNGVLNEPFNLLISGDVGYEAFLFKIHPSKVDYLLGFGSSIFAAIVMIICFFTFVRRIFDIILLYITSPYFSATIVLDDGEKFKRWRETFIAKTVMGFGSAIGMRIYLMIIPIVMSPNLRFFNTMAGEWAGGYIVRIVFLLGGMYAVHKSSSLLTSIISSSVGAQENADNAYMAAMVTSGAKRMAFATGGAFSKALKGKSAGKDNKSSGNKFKGDLGTTSKFNSGKFDDKFKSDLKETFGISKDGFKEDYISENTKLKENTKPFMPLQDANDIKLLNYDVDYISKDDSKGNANTDGITHYDGYDPLGTNKPQVPDMSSVRKFNGEQVASGLVSKNMSDNFEEKLKSAGDYTSPDSKKTIDIKSKPKVIKTADGHNMIELEDLPPDDEDSKENSSAANESAKENKESEAAKSAESIVEKQKADSKASEQAKAETAKEKKESENSSDFVLDPFESFGQMAAGTSARESAEDVLMNDTSKQNESGGSSAAVKPNVVEVSDPLKVNKRTDHKNDSNKF